jgi:tetratricopeptide (TPR) repeat protein
VANKHTLKFTTVAVLMFAGSGFAQPQTDGRMLTGELRTNGNSASGGSVILTGLSSTRDYVSTDVRSDGSFLFQAVPLGDYRLRVMDATGREVHAEIISLHGQPSPLLLDLPGRDNSQPVGSTVSLTELLHPPSKKAKQAFRAAAKLSAAGQHARAATELEKAIELSPEFADAWVNLAAQHLRMHINEQALQELNQAMQLSGATPIILGNMAFALGAMNREPEAIAAAKRALQLDPSYAPAHYFLGCYLSRNRRTLNEGIIHLQAAAPTIPSANRALESARNDQASYAAATVRH